MKKRCLLTGVIILVLFFYLIMNLTPVYPGELTISLRNNTLKKITDLIIEFEGAGYEIKIDEISPMERIIVIPPNDIYDKPLKAQIYIKYNGERLFLEDYYSLTGDKYNSDVVQTIKATITKKRLETIENSLLCRLSILPYFKVYDYR